MQVEINGQVKNTQILLNSDVIQKRIQTLAQEINQHYQTNETIVVLIVLNGALIFAADLIRHFHFSTEIETVRIKSYHDTQSSGVIELLSPLPTSLINKHVLIVEDIIDTACSMNFLLNKLKEHGVKSVEVCTLLNKPNEHIFPIQAKYIGFNIGKNFVIGYGLDLNDKYRNLPYIAEIVQDV